MHIAESTLAIDYLYRLSCGHQLVIVEVDYRIAFGLHITVSQHQALPARIAFGLHKKANQCRTLSSRIVFDLNITIT